MMNVVVPKAPEPTRDEVKARLLRDLEGSGYIVPKGSKFWKVERESGPTKGRDDWGWQVGEFKHSCHIDHTDFIVLFFIDSDRKDRLEYHSDLWLPEPIVV